MMPTPLTPAVCDLRDFTFMPLDVVRLRDSDIAAKSTGDEFRCAVLLWCASWHQVPAASLPDDDEVLAKLAGYGRVVKEWRKVREGALRGWIKCDDGRIYHPVVAEKANEAWASKLEQRWKTECARIKKQNQRHGTQVPCPSFDEYMSLGTTKQCPEGQQPPVPGLSLGKHDPRDRDRDRDSNYKDKTSSGDNSSARDPANNSPPFFAPPEREPPNPDAVTSRAVELAVLLRNRGAALQPGDPNVRQWAADGVTDAQALTALETAQQRRAEKGSGQPINSGFLNTLIAEARASPATGTARQNPNSTRRSRHDEQTELAAKLTGRDRQPERREINVTGLADGLD